MKSPALLAVFIASLFACGFQRVPSKSQTVIIRIPVRLMDPHTDTPLMDAEGRHVDQHGFAADIKEFLAGSKIGTYDFDFLAGDTLVISLHGPSADRLSKALMPVLRERSYSRTISVKRRYGPKGSKESTLYVKPH